MKAENLGLIDNMVNELAWGKLWDKSFAKDPRY